jgi:hypothetical protein
MKKVFSILLIIMFGASYLSTIVPNSYAQATAPIPFRPGDTNIEKAIEESAEKIGTIEIGERVTGKETTLQKIPIFSIKTSGIRFVITALFFIAAPIALIVIVYSAVRLIIKPEDEELVSKMKRTLIYSSIGLLIMALAYAIVQNIITVF